MWIFQAPYDFIERWTAPKWLKVMLQELNDIMFAILKQISEEYINFLKEQIIAADKADGSQVEKFKYVFTQAKKHLPEFTVRITDEELSAIIAYLTSSLKKRGAV